jgi:hypothetical protein
MPPASRLTKALQERICKLVEVGNFPETAAVAEGVPARTFWNWMKWGRDALAETEGQQAGEPGSAPRSTAGSRSLYVDFVLAVDRARARAEADLVKTVRKGDTKHRKVARAAGWLLERTRSKRFGAVIRHRVEDELERMLDIAERVLARNDFLRLCEAIAAADRETETGEASGGGGSHAVDPAPGRDGSDQVH